MNFKLKIKKQFLLSFFKYGFLLYSELSKSYGRKTYHYTKKQKNTIKNKLFVGRRGGGVLLGVGGYPIYIELS
jgi:hypothetical protein